MICISLPRHPVIIARKYYCENAFPDLMEGRPTRSMIDERIRLAKSTANDSSVGLISKFANMLRKKNVAYHDVKHDYDKFPSHYCIADFESTNATDNVHTMSFLTVCWFMDFHTDLGYVESIQEVLKDFDWDKCAVNGDW